MWKVAANPAERGKLTGIGFGDSSFVQRWQQWEYNDGDWFPIPTGHEEVTFTFKFPDGYVPYWLNFRDQLRRLDEEQEIGGKEEEIFI